MKSLCDQNSKCKEFIKENVEDKQKSDRFLTNLQIDNGAGKQEQSEDEEEEVDEEDELWKI